MLGRHALAKLQELQAAHGSTLRNARGRGLFLAIEHLHNEAAAALREALHLAFARRDPHAADFE